MGHAAVGEYLKRVRAQETVVCRKCQAPTETIQHALLECRGWRTQRHILRRDLTRAGVQLPTMAEKAPEARLFENRKATKTLLIFIATTEVGVRQEEQQQKAERM